MSCADTICPMAMSPLAVRTSTVSIFWAGSGATHGLFGRAAGEQCRDTARSDGDDQNDDTRGFHTLHFPGDRSAVNGAHD